MTLCGENNITNHTYSAAFSSGFINWGFGGTTTGKVIDNITIQGKDDNDYLNINVADNTTGITFADVNNINIKDININIAKADETSENSAQDEDICFLDFVEFNDIKNINIDNANINISGETTDECYGRMIYFTNKTPEAITFTDCETVSPGYFNLMYSELTMYMNSGDEEKIDQWILTDGDASLNSLKIEKTSSPCSNTIFTADACGVTKGKSFSFNLSEKDFIGVLHDSKLLSKGKDYTVSKDGEMLNITFTDKFFKTKGDYPVPVLFSFDGAPYYLTASKE